MERSIAAVAHQQFIFLGVLLAGHADLALGAEPIILGDYILLERRITAISVEALRATLANEDVLCDDAFVPCNLLAVLPVALLACLRTVTVLAVVQLLQSSFLIIRLLAAATLPCLRGALHAARGLTRS